MSDGGKIFPVNHSWAAFLKGNGYTRKGGNCVEYVSVSLGGLALKGKTVLLRSKLFPFRLGEDSFPDKL